MEFNFSLYWGLAIQAYESTLVSDETPVDRFFRGDTNALTPAAVRGLGVFQGKGDCTECHRGPAMTSATTLEIAGGDPGENGTELDKLGRWMDDGFDNIGVRPTEEDKGLGGTDPPAGSLSIARPDRVRRPTRSTAPSRCPACATSSSPRRTSTTAAS